MWIEILKWVFVLVALVGAYEGTKPNSNNLLMNGLFFCSNLFSVIYFAFISEWAFMVRNGIFWIIAIIGVYRNGRERRD